ncbi:bifunctional DNA primase/polymerase [Streptacidiphilus monticola]|uniref:Bifunctional DNA primase/polymerase n=1 Tax=Streptacidiphilus monticola TaxID=2161674 RepID=A0ABW1GAI9_9ACTN
MAHPGSLPLLSYALAAVRRGWHVFPLVPGGKTPALRGWPQQATRDPGQVTAWWQHKPYNVGIATGPSRLLVVDLDTAKPGDAIPESWALPGVVDGADVLAALAERHGQPYPADTFTVATASGGTHLYFRRPEHGPQLRNTAGRLGWKIDTRATGGMVVGPGSTTAKGTYRVISATEVAPLPGWLADLLTPPPQPPARPVAVPLHATDRRTAYLKAAVERQLAHITRAPDHHNDALSRSAAALGQLVAGGELSEQDVTAWLMDAAATVGHDPRKAAATIRSGLAYGARRPRTVAA